MSLIFKRKKEIETYIFANWELDIKTIALSSLEYLLKVEKLSIKDISRLFHVHIDEVEDLLFQNGLL